MLQVVDFKEPVKLIETELLLGSRFVCQLQIDLFTIGRDFGALR